MITGRCHQDRLEYHFLYYDDSIVIFSTSLNVKNVIHAHIIHILYILYKYMQAKEQNMDLKNKRYKESVCGTWQREAKGLSYNLRIVHKQRIHYPTYTMGFPTLHHRCTQE